MIELNESQSIMIHSSLLLSQLLAEAVPALSLSHSNQQIKRLTQKKTTANKTQREQVNYSCIVE